MAEIVHESGVLAGRQPWRREASPDDARVRERLGTMLDATDKSVAPGAAAAAPRMRWKPSSLSLEQIDITI